ncbi:MAG: VWA domain-containing protein [Bradymonadales bacterium]|nr:VWA domain-containing protein [Bradymonadales bacterium]
MTRLCQYIQERLSEDGLAGLRNDTEALTHLGSCDDCFELLLALNEVNAGLAALDPIHPPETLVERTLAATATDLQPSQAIEQEPGPRPDGGAIPPKGRPSPTTPVGPGSPQKFRSSIRHVSRQLVRPFRPMFKTKPRALVTLGATLVLLLAVGSTSLVLLSGQNDKLAEPVVSYLEQRPLDESRDYRGADVPMGAPEVSAGWETTHHHALGGRGDFSGQAAPAPDDRAMALLQEPYRDSESRSLEMHGAHPVTIPRSSASSTSSRARDDGETMARPTTGMLSISAAGETVPTPEVVEVATDEEDRAGDRGVTLATRPEGYWNQRDNLAQQELVDQSRFREAYPVARRTPSTDGGPAVIEEMGALAVTETDATFGPLDRPTLVANELGYGERAAFDFEGARLHAAWDPDEFAHIDADFDGLVPSDLTLDSDIERARLYVARRAETTGLLLQEARGYWANTYLPGDPILRRLQRRLTETRDLPLAHTEHTGFTLASHSQRVTQPFDSPNRNSLGVYLASDTTAVQGPTRVLLQVGLQGTARERGRRPAMNIGVVVDLTGPVSADHAAHIQALLSALSEAAEVGDRFSLTVAGRPGGTVIDPGSFRHGEVVVAMQPLFSGEPLVSPKDGEVTLGLADAMLAATESVRTEDDPNQPLGSSLVMVVVPRTIESGVDQALERIAHQSAVEGVPVSVVAVGRNVDLAQLDQIALAGQGSRRLLDSTGQASSIVAAELTAASRAVARAVRLRIRLADGVQLVDVLGSYRLDEAGAQRVREAERSIDRRLSRSLGIQSDRGEDEDGIQIVIPVFYAEDSHVILLDLVVDGPGPVADVTVRYKDLVHLRNSVARDHLSLQRGRHSMGPLERNVFKNLLAFELSEALKRAGSQVREGRTDLAVATIQEISSLLRGMRQTIGELGTDPEIENDLAMLARYLTVLQTVAGSPLPVPNELADSLLYASYLKRLPPPGADSP